MTTIRRSEGTFSTPDGATAPRGTEGVAAALAFGFATLAALFPILQADIPPLVDYPAHLARLHILSSLASTPELQRIYEANWGVVPNLAMDVLALPLVKLFGIYTAGRIFVALTLVLILGGAVCLNWVLHRRVGAWPAFAALFLYNFALFWGFVNYLFGLGLVLFAVAGWFGSSRWRPSPRLVVFTLVATALFFSHLFAFGIYGLTVAASELRQVWKQGRGKDPDAWRAAVLSLAQFAMPAVLFVLFLRGEGGGFTSYGTAHDKILALLSPTLLSGGIIDRVAAVFAGFVFIRGLFSRSLLLAPAMKAPLVAMTAVAVVMPSWLMGTWGADMRLPIALSILLVASCRIELENRAVLAGFAACATVVLFVRSGLIAEQWRDYDMQFAEFRRATAAIEPGSKLIVATHEPPETLEHKPYWHMAALAVIERSVFLPTLFTDKHRHSVRVKAPYDTIDAIDVTPLPIRMLVETSDPVRGGRWKRIQPERDVNPFWTDWPERFDYVLVLHGHGTANPLPHLLAPIASGSVFDLYRIKPSASPAP